MQNRSTQRYEPLPADHEVRLVKRMNQLAQEHPRCGYRMVATLIRSERWAINRKRVERLWRLEGNRVPPRRSKASGKRAEGASDNAWNLPADYRNHITSFDFVVKVGEGEPEISGHQSFANLQRAVEAKPERRARLDRERVYVPTIIALTAARAATDPTTSSCRCKTGGPGERV